MYRALYPKTRKKNKNIKYTSGIFSILRAYFAFTAQRYHTHRERVFDPAVLTADTPHDIIAYIYQQCEAKDTKDRHGRLQSCQGKSVCIADLTVYLPSCTSNIVVFLCYSIRLP